MKLARSVYFGAIVLALIIGLGLWHPAKVKAKANPPDSTPTFSVDPAWPHNLPNPVGTDGVAHQWVTGEIAGTCVDANDNVYTFNRGWEVGVTINGVLQGNESGAIVGQDASASAIPSPPVVAYTPAGDVYTAWGNPSLIQTGPSYGGAAVMPQGAHGCYVDYQGNIWVGGNGDGVVQKYTPDGTMLLQIGRKGICDGSPANSKLGGSATFTTCGETKDYNRSTVLLNEPADITVDPEPDPVTGNPGDIYIADGYGNHRIVVFDASGTYLRQWGSSCGHNSPDCPNGTFGATGGGHPHCVILGNDNLVYVCDRPDSRIQVFDKMGNWQRNIIITPPSSIPAGVQAAILAAGTRACDMDFYPNIDVLGDESPTSQAYIVDVDLGNDNTWLIDKPTGDMLGAFGACGIAPCPGHNAGHFGFGHTTASDSKGNVYIAETITGRRIQKFVPNSK
jgi:NHL repeat